MAFPTDTVLTAGTILQVQTLLANRTLPTITVTVAAGVGTGAALGTVTVSGGAITSIPVTTGGTGYVAGQTFVNITGTGTGATAVPVISAGVITSITITNGGTGYTGTPTATIATGGAIGASSIPITAAASPAGLNRTAGLVLVQQGTTLTFNSTTPQTVTLAADVLVGDTSISIASPLTAAVSAGNIATSSGLLRVLGGDSADFNITDKEVETRSFENGLFDDARKVMIGGSVPFNGFYRVGDPAFNLVIKPAVLSAQEVYCYLLSPDKNYWSGSAFLKGYKETNKLDDIRRFSWEFRLVGAFQNGVAP